jgi:site-specific DNA recombinase
MKTAVIYCRVSTQDQADTGTSLESQAAACQTYAEQNDYRVIEVLKESRSGASLNRPMLDKVRYLVREGVVQAVIFYALDRLSRDETDTLILAREFRNHGAELRCATTSLEDSPQGQFLLTMLAAVGKLERAGILERTMRGKRQTIRNGKIMHSRSPKYGYTQHEGSYEINETEAYWVKRMYEWYCGEGLSLLTIAFRLAELGAPTSNGGKWTSTRVRRILNDITYTGEYWWGKTDTTSKTDAAGRKYKARPSSEWIGPIAVPPIVSREAYEAARERVEYNKVNSTRRCKTEYLLRGMVTCQLCKRRLAGVKFETTKQLHTYYVCTRQLHSVPGEHCEASRVNGRRAEEKVWKWAVTKLSDPNFIRGLVEGTNEGERAQQERDDADMRSLLDLRAEAVREEDKLIDLYTNDAITLDKFKERMNALQERQNGILKNIAEIDARKAARTQAAQDVKNAVALVQKVQRSLPKRKLMGVVSFAEKRAVLEALHCTITALPDGDVDVTGYISSDLLKLAGIEEQEDGEGGGENYRLSVTRHGEAYDISYQP